MPLGSAVLRGVQQGEAHRRVVAIGDQLPQLLLELTGLGVGLGVGHQQDVVGPAQGPTAPGRPAVVDLVDEVAVGRLEAFEVVREAQRADVVVADLGDALAREVLVDPGAAHRAGVGAEGFGQLRHEGVGVDPRGHGHDHHRELARAVEVRGRSGPPEGDPSHLEPDPRVPGQERLVGVAAEADELGVAHGVHRRGARLAVDEGHLPHQLAPAHLADLHLDAAHLAEGPQPTGGHHVGGVTRVALPEQARSGGHRDPVHELLDLGQGLGIDHPEAGGDVLDDLRAPQSFRGSLSERLALDRVRGHELLEPGGGKGRDTCIRERSHGSRPGPSGEHPDLPEHPARFDGGEDLVAVLGLDGHLEAALQDDEQPVGGVVPAEQLLAGREVQLAELLHHGREVHGPEPGHQLAGGQRLEQRRVSSRAAHGAFRPHRPSPRPLQRARP